MNEIFATAITTSSPSQGPPLVVDLDGTLVRSDLLIEMVFSELARDPFTIFSMVRALLKGKAALKHRLAETATIDAARLPYDEEVLSFIRKAKSEGRPVYLASASNQRFVEAVADHLGVFAGWFASDHAINLSGAAKAQRLSEEFGNRGFDYIGNGRADLPVWAQSAKAVVIRIPPRTLRRLTKINFEIETFPADRPSLRQWIKLMRIHQYAKNALIFVPLFFAHHFSFNAIQKATFAVVAFSLCASSVYVLNDLVDLRLDRSHPTKRNRPLASGAIPLIDGVFAVPILFFSAVLFAMLVSFPFLGVILGYFALTTAYSFVLKQKMLIDVVALAMLYVVRVIAGGVAVSVTVSEWLLAFSMFIFLSLALIKRYVELAVRINSGLPDPANRNYKLVDLEIVAALAAAAGFNAVTVFALYLSSDTVHLLYQRPGLMWLICPILIYWISRALMMAHRRLMNDDPIVFALRDKNSLIAGALIALLVIAAI